MYLTYIEIGKTTSQNLKHSFSVLLMSATVLPHAAGVVETLGANGAQKRRLTRMRPNVYL